MEYVAVEREQKWEDRVAGARQLRLLPGSATTPSAILNRIGPGFTIAPHFHDVDQFQIVLEGSAVFPRHEVKAGGVHYTDAYMPYGPFHGGPEGLLFIVLRQTQSRIFMMGQRPAAGAPRPIPSGRELVAEAEGGLGAPRAGARVSQYVVLDAGGEGPRVEMLQCGPGADVSFQAAPFGEYHVIIKGSCSAESRRMEKYAARYVCDEKPSPVKCGPEGATILVARFGRAGQTATGG